jgi:hypothetical protein
MSKKKIQHIIELLKLVLTLDDEEMVKVTIESIIEILEEETNSKSS